MRKSFGMAILALVVLMAGCSKEGETAKSGSGTSASAPVAGGCDSSTLERCSEEQKAMIRMSGSGLKK